MLLVLPVAGVLGIALKIMSSFDLKFIILLPIFLRI